MGCDPQGAGRLCYLVLTSLGLETKSWKSRDNSHSEGIQIQYCDDNGDVMVACLEVWLISYRWVPTEGVSWRLVNDSFARKWRKSHREAVSRWRFLATYILVRISAELRHLALRCKRIDSVTLRGSDPRYRGLTTKSESEDSSCSE